MVSMRHNCPHIRAERSSNFLCAAVPGYSLSSHGSLSSCPPVGSLQPLEMAPQTGQRSWHLSLLLPIMASYWTLQWYGTAVARPRSPCLCSTTTPSRLTSIPRGDSPYSGSPPAVPLRGADRSPYFFMLVLFSAVLFQVASNFRGVRTCLPGRVRHRVWPSQLIS